MIVRFFKAKTYENLGKFAGPVPAGRRMRKPPHVHAVWTQAHRSLCYNESGTWRLKHTVRSQAITVTLPDEVYQRVKRNARGMKQPVPQVLVRIVEAA